MRKLYEPHALPFTRVIRGLPVSWETYAAATTCPFNIELVAWSPCSRFIALSPWGSVTVDVLDSLTLQKLQCLESEGDIVSFSEALMFSPDGRTLASSGHNATDGVSVVSWHLQIGCVAGVIRWKSQIRYSRNTHIAYSTTGKMVGVLRRDRIVIISVCDVVSNEHLHDVYLPNNPGSCRFWSHGESLWVAAAYQTTSKAAGPTPSITIWELEFTAGIITEVETLSVPESIGISTHHEICFLQSMIHPQSLQAPRPAALIYTTPRVGVLVWDAQNFKTLLYQDGDYLGSPTFSSDGRFFACPADGEVRLWKCSPTGYVLHGKLPFCTNFSTPLLSPDGESITVWGDSMIALWHTRNLTIIPSDSFVGPTPRDTDDFVLEFHPDRPSAAVARKRDNTVTLLDLNAGDPQLIINTGMPVWGLGVTGETIVAIRRDGATTWKLPGGTFLPGVAMGPLDYTRAVEFNGGYMMTGVLSPDSRYILTVEPGKKMSVHCGTTGEYLCGDKARSRAPWFTPDSHNIRLLINEDKGWVREVRTVTTAGALQHQLSEGTIVDVVQGQWECPYISSCGYQVTDDKWILGPSGKRLLILPPLWRLGTFLEQRKWKGQFLALLHGQLPEPVILELDP